jgi:hypothetical protein
MRRRAGTLQGSAGTEYAAAPAAPGAAAAGGADANHLPSLGQSHADGHNGTIGACQSGLQAQHLPTVSSTYAPPDPAFAAEEVAKNLDIDSYEDQRNSMLSIALDDAPTDSTHPKNDVWRELDWS